MQGGRKGSHRPTGGCPESGRDRQPRGELTMEPLPEYSRFLEKLKRKFRLNASSSRPACCRNCLKKRKLKTDGRLPSSKRGGRAAGDHRNLTGLATPIPAPLENTMDQYRLIPLQRESAGLYRD